MIKLNIESEQITAKIKPKININIKKPRIPKVGIINVDDDEAEKDQEMGLVSTTSKNNEMSFDLLLLAELKKYSSSQHMVFGVDGKNFLKEELVPTPNVMALAQSVKINRRTYFQKNLSPQ